ncbi:transaldolase [Candidatus Uhrbacteria bacterium]|nr:transaldolase [Candidatus Uhrbacteria bacterium]
MRPLKLGSRIFVDGGDAEETKALKDALGFLDGQTTNPSLVAKNPEAKARLDRGEKFAKQELLDFYKGIVQEVSMLVPDGSVSVEVYADAGTTAQRMFVQGKEMYAWIPNAHIKYPTTAAGLEAAELSVKEGMRVNMTLVFSQAQAAAVYAATRGAHKGQVFVSPFVGRLDDRGQNGMSLIKNIMDMYAVGDGHVEVLTASVRTIEHLQFALALESDIITAPAKVLYEWAENGLLIPDAKYHYDPNGLVPIPYESLDLAVDWKSFAITHELTDKGIDRFAADWNALLV